MIRHHFLHAGILVVALAAPASAQSEQPVPLSKEGSALVLDALAHKLTLPLPDWLEEAAIAEDVEQLVEARFALDSREAVLRILPKGETQEDWQTLYGARITLEPERSLDDLRRATMVAYARTCTPGVTGFFQLGEDEEAPLGFVCGIFSERLEGYAGKGEVVLMTFERTDAGVAVIYQEWRGRAFDPANPTTWPVPTEDVELRARQFADGVELLVAGD